MNKHKIMTSPYDVRTTYRVSCDECGKIEVIHLDTVEDLPYITDVLEELGWLGKICPNCRRKKLND
jgi:hypothetical protein